VPRRDPEATAAALHTLLTDRRRRADAAAAGIAAIRHDHDPHALMKSYDEVLRAARGEQPR
jgi:hypothetical protein